jgi:hypothetical protein
MLMDSVCSSATFIFKAIMTRGIVSFFSLLFVEDAFLWQKNTYLAHLTKSNDDNRFASMKVLQAVHFLPGKEGPKPW